MGLPVESPWLTQPPKDDYDHIFWLVFWSKFVPLGSSDWLQFVWVPKDELHIPILIDVNDDGIVFYCVG
jgi:hypothetical protein